jgi:phosphoribosylformylglycinamidine synthase
VLREQGVNSQYEMAAVFMRAGFTAVDVHMSDLLSGRDSLVNYQGLVACGGFSFGDVLGFSHVVTRLHLACVTVAR